VVAMAGTGSGSARADSTAGAAVWVMVAMEGTVVAMAGTGLARDAVAARA
jgi:hypothetical protein